MSEERLRVRAQAGDGACYVGLSSLKLETLDRVEVQSGRQWANNEASDWDRVGDKAPAGEQGDDRRSSGQGDAIAQEGAVTEACKGVQRRRARLTMQLR